MSPKIHIDIDAIEVDLRGVPPAVARNATANLGSSLQQAIAAQIRGSRASGSIRVEQVPAVPVRVSAKVDAATLQSVVVQQVATSIARQLPSQNA